MKLVPVTKAHIAKGVAENCMRIDKLLRKRLTEEAAQFMHQARVPLDEAPLLPASREGQMDLFGNECEGMCGV